MKFEWIIFFAVIAAVAALIKQRRFISGTISEIMHYRRETTGKPVPRWLDRLTRHR